MKRKPTEATTYTAAKFASLTGIDRHELQKRLETAGAKPDGKSAQGAGLYRLRDLARAFAGDEQKSAQLKKTAAETERLELANARARGELVEIAAVKKLGERVMIAIRQRILNMPLTDEEKDKCLLDLRSLGDMDWSRDP